MKKQGVSIDLTKEQKKTARTKIKEYAEEELEVEISNLQGDMFLDFITKHIGPLYYNKAIADASEYMTEKTEDMYVLMKEEPAD